MSYIRPNQKMTFSLCLKPILNLGQNGAIRSALYRLDTYYYQIFNERVKRFNAYSKNNIKQTDNP